VVGVLDYGVGNLLSVTRAFAAVNADPVLVSSEAEIMRLRYLVLPGVGAFGNAMVVLRERGLVEPIREFVAKGGGFLGICLGMQLMLEDSTEFGEHEGLGLIAGSVRPISNRAEDGSRLKIPHVGWTPLIPSDPDAWRHSLLTDLDPKSAVYCVHSFAAVPKNPAECLAYCDYGGQRIAAVLAKDNVIGCQFHPEKSGPVGLKILQNFIKAG
jgi:glutamine amidotransferase